jgi:hypothetical protein
MIWWQAGLICFVSIVLGYLMGSLGQWWPYVKIAWRRLWRKRRTQKQFLDMAANAHFVEGTPQQQATRFRQRTNDGGSAGHARIRTARMRFRAPRQK